MWPSVAMLGGFENFDLIDLLFEILSQNVIFFTPFSGKLGQSH
jgi:hypothetical protein